MKRAANLHINMPSRCRTIDTSIADPAQPECTVRRKSNTRLHVDHHTQIDTATPSKATPEIGPK